MDFFRKAGIILGRTFSNQINKGISSPNSSFSQAIRCMSTSKLFIGGISYNTDDTSLKEAFGKYGEVAEARVIVDRDTGRSRGFGFVTYTSEEEASAAIQALDQQELQGRRIRVNYANDRTRGFGGGGYGNGGGYGGGSGYGGGGYGSGGGGYGEASNFGSGTESFPASGGAGFADGGNQSYIGAGPIEGFSQDDSPDSYADRKV